MVAILVSKIDLNYNLEKKGHNEFKSFFRNRFIQTGQRLGLEIHRFRSPRVISKILGKSYYIRLVKNSENRHSRREALSLPTCFK